VFCQLTPTDFESLIQNLFTKMGLEARQTRPSRDGGVDCVAYDTRPIFGGKVVIQAKRYKNTVGVSAVRDLFGTLQNEGASKGILVTTSGYGPASFEFAQNKPIELIDGSNLLYLLETYAGMTARIEPPDDWKDPVLDSGEPWLGSSAAQPSQKSEMAANEPTPLPAHEADLGPPL
jgi:restriction endonuclease Mrr